jgi:SET domain-containing protein
MLEVRQSRNGRGAFALIPIRRGSIVWDWSDVRRFTSDQIPNPYVKDAYLQVAENLYIGPDNPGDWPLDAADFVNHSCDPNCAVGMSLPAILLVALRAIEAGEEITYDYAVTMHNDPWEMKCNCGALECRGTIRTSSEPRQSTKR